VRSATLRRQALSLLNGISMGSDPLSMGADSGVWRRAVRSALLAQELCVPKIVDDDDVVALARWREIGRGFRYAQPGAVRTCFRAIAWRESVIVRLD